MSAASRRNSYLNILTSVVSQVIILILGFLVPRVVMDHYGSDANGVLATVTQIFTYLALMEAGIGQATKNSLYGPIQSDNKPQISHCLSLAKRTYRKVSIIYGIAIITVAALLPLILKTNVSYVDICIYVLLEGISNVISFYCINTWSCFLDAAGKSYISNIVSVVYKIVVSLSRVLLALAGVRLMFIQTGFLAATLCQWLLLWLYMRKKYGWIDYHVPTDGEKLQDKNSYAVNSIAWTVFSSTDMIILSVVLSTQLASVYSVYSMVFTALSGFLNSVYFSLTYSLGQTYFESKEKYVKLHYKHHSFFLMLLTILMCVALWLTIPFVRLYTEGVDDVDYVYQYLPVLFSLVQFLSWCRYVPGNLVGIAGYAKKIVPASIAEAVINLALSFALVFPLGIYGVLIATVLALPIKVAYCTWLSDVVILQISMKKTIAIDFANFIVLAVTAVACFFVEIPTPNFGFFILYGLALTFGYSLILLGVNLIANRDLLELFPKRSSQR
ncbi:MAG: hypothetical protein ACI32C_04355 [Candidatus Enteromonas sp.]